MTRLTQILGPQYLHAPLVVFNLGEAELVLSLPQHESTIDSLLAQSDIDIFNQELYQGGPPTTEWYIILVKHAWVYRFASSDIDAGTMYLTMAVVHTLDDQNNYNFLESSSFGTWVADCVAKNYAPLDESSIEELKLNELPVTEKDMWIYPKQIGDLEKLIKNGMHWYRGHTGHPSMGKPQPFFRTPINQHYALEIIIQFGGFNPEYFEFPETIEATKEALLQEFLEHVRITYPPEILAQVTNTNNL